jgi:galactonate dehydratase
MEATIERIDRHPVEVPFREVPERNMARELLHWRYFEVLEVELADGSIGYGETMLFYGWGKSETEDIERARGSNAADLMWDDSIGPGLQQSLFDAVGRSLGVPVHRLIGTKVRDEAPISWWCIDMPPEDWVSEAKLALDRGYTNLKVKGRPWFDIRAQLEALDRELPEWFSVDIDFNSTLLSADRAIPVLEDLQEYPQVSHFEGPIGGDPEEHRRLVETLDVPIVLHYGGSDMMTTLSAPECDGFVASEGASELRDIAGVTKIADKPFWLQLVGTGITAAFSLHCGGVFEQAKWPAINCHQLYEHPLLEEPIEVEDGHAEVPDSPGLGYRVDRDALEEFAVERPESQPNPERLIECDWPGGPTIYFSEEGEGDQLLSYARSEPTDMPYFEGGVTTRTVENDGSDTWREHHDAAADGPVLREESAF